MLRQQKVLLDRFDWLLIKIRPQFIVIIIPRITGVCFLIKLEVSGSGSMIVSGE